MAIRVRSAKRVVFKYLRGKRTLMEVPTCYRSLIHEIYIVNHILLRNGNVIIPLALRPQVLELLHAGHLGTAKMKAMSRKHVWWPMMAKDILIFAKRCAQCNKNAAMPKHNKLAKWPPANKVWDRIHLDFFEFDGQQYIILVDARSSWLEFKRVNNLSTNVVIEFLKNLIGAYGIPRSIVTDNGRAFTSKEFADFCELLKIKHLFSPPYHPSSNGLAERHVAVVKRWLKDAKVEKNGTWLYRLYHNAAPRFPAREPVSSIFLNRLPNLPLDMLIDDTHDCAESPPISKFKIGDLVWARNYGGYDKWLEATILSLKGSKLYEIIMSSNLTNRICHEGQLRPRL